ncbi:MAG TPA: TldD/PmbA family protein [Acidimicrobiales bacterium]|nr:TldD/PmbA family protein [Acidimicrobiales bacterium]
MADTVSAEVTRTEAGGLTELASRIASQAKKDEQLEVYVSRGVETEVRAYDGEIESLSSASSAGVGIRVISAGRQGFAYAGSLDQAIIDEVLADARDNVAFASPDEHVGLAEDDGFPAVDLDLWDEGLTSLAETNKIDLALELERLTRNGDPLVRQVDSADYGDVAVEAAIATSNGLSASTRRTICSLSVSAIAGEGADSQTGVGFSAGRGPDDLDLERASRDAIERSTRMLGATKTKSGLFTVVLDQRVTSTLLAIISSALSGEAVTKGRSFFADRVGEQVAVPQLTLTDDPTDARAFGASAHDAEALACRRNVLIGAGVLNGFVFDSTSARRAGTVSTGSAVRGGYASTPVAGCRALSLEPGDLDASQILAEVGDGLFVQSITGVHSGVNPVSGDFSVGIEGLIVRGGSLAEPVREVTIASTLQKMLLSVTQIGADIEWLPGLSAGLTLAIDGMSLSGS